MPGRMTFYYNPMSRAATARWMLEEVGAEYETVPVDFEAGDNRKPDFLAINPMGKIPTLVLDDGTVLTETAAILAWLADAYPSAGLAPAPGTPSRGSYYRWLFFGGSCFEPALTETMMRRDAAPLSKGSVGWGSYNDVVDTLELAVSRNPYLVGGQFSAADVYIGSQLSWAGSFGAPRIQDSAAIQAYVERVVDRDAYRRAMRPA
ncbi:glutathione S-transferase family protein [Aurantimonas sp. A2-1-M11]|uniref:glutathione S-transferase family protein n=1 Tax=Aurantimonas sp. A2-1-M11 TaxID=3113712 RepID=UPI002F9251C2